jgi:plastocyanin
MNRSLKWAVPATVLFALVPVTSGTAASRHAQRAAAAQTFTVNVDQTPAKANESFLTYFPRAVTVHPGDTVSFHWAGNGEPHTVTLGTLADNAVRTFNQLTPAQKNSNGPPPPAMAAADAAVPSLFPQGPGDAIQSVSNPCYQQSGSVGTAICPNSQHEQPDFNGRQVYYNSGWLDSGSKWSMRVSSSTAPGIYRYMCALHREEMQGKITVAPATKTIMSPAEQYALGQKQLAAATRPLDPAVKALRVGKPPVPGVTLPGTNPVLAGSGVPNSSGAVDEYGLRTMKVPVGGSVTWWLLGPHSITFNSNKTNDDIRVEAPDGSVHINAPAFAPAGGPGEPPPSNGGPSKGIHFKVVASSSWNGQGHHSSGVYTNSFGPPLIEGYKLTFTKAGVYHYLCTVHDHMKGTVVVG